MSSIIVVFPRLEDAKNIKNLLMRNGFKVEGICTSGAQAIGLADALQGGIIVCGYRFSDMIYKDLFEDMPPDFEMLLVASPKYLADTDEGIVCLSMPIKLNELVATLGMMIESRIRRRRKQRQQPKIRSAEEKKLIEDAKSVLMERNHLTESDAHKYLQKCSMDTGTNLVESAQMVLRMMQEQEK